MEIFFIIESAFFLHFPGVPHVRTAPFFVYREPELLFRFLRKLKEGKKRARGVFEFFSCHREGDRGEVFLPYLGEEAVVRKRFFFLNLVTDPDIAVRHTLLLYTI